MHPILPISWLYGEVSRTAREARERVLASHKAPPYRVEGSKLVSVIVPTLNERDWVPNLVRSIKGQTYGPIEVVCADSSTDETPEICRELGCTVVRVPELNVSKARNKGAEASIGSILLFCDADVILEPSYVERAVGELEKGYALAHGVECTYEDSYQTLVVIGRYFLKPRLHTTGRGVAIGREDFRLVGGYNESLDPKRGEREDLEFGERASRIFGIHRIKLMTDAFAGTSLRRERKQGFFGLWKVRGVRNGIIP